MTETISEESFSPFLLFVGIYLDNMKKVGCNIILSLFIIYYLLFIVHYYHSSFIIHRSSLSFFFWMDRWMDGWMNG